MPHIKKHHSLLRLQVDFWEPMSLLSFLQGQVLSIVQVVVSADTAIIESYEDTVADKVLGDSKQAYSAEARGHVFKKYICRLIAGRYVYHLHSVV